MQQYITSSWFRLNLNKSEVKNYCVQGLPLSWVMILRLEFVNSFPPVKVQFLWLGEECPAMVIRSVLLWPLQNPVRFHLTYIKKQQVFNSGYGWLFYSGEMWSISKVFSIFIPVKDCQLTLSKYDKNQWFSIPSHFRNLKLKRLFASGICELCNLFSKLYKTLYFMCVYLAMNKL